MSDKLQPFAPLDEETEFALRDSISKFGVVVPIIVDKTNRILDGHHRSRIAKELGVNCPQITRHVKNDDDAATLAFSLNADRRQMTADQRRAVVADLRGQGYSLRSIAGVTGVSLAQTNRDVGKVFPPGTPDTDTEAGGSPTTRPPASVKGQDGSKHAPQKTEAQKAAAAETRRKNALNAAAEKQDEEHPDLARNEAWTAARPILRALFDHSPQAIAGAIDLELRDDDLKQADTAEQWFGEFFKALQPNLKVAK